jgi:tRNA 2-thiouridine synthesizing protein A
VTHVRRVGGAQCSIHNQTHYQEEIMADKELDARGLNCPLPILRAKKTLNEMTSGQTLKIIATDPGSLKDFQAFAKQTGNTLLESNEAGGEYTFLLKKG